MKKPVHLVADAECPYCKGKGIKVEKHFTGAIRYGGPPRPSYKTKALCMCVESVPALPKAPTKGS